MITRERFTLAQLVERTGTTPATVRHYLDLGLLPRPHREAANRFRYDSRHEQAIRLIRLLQERRQLPLSQIRRLLPELLRIPGEQAFHPEMWDETVEVHLRERGRQLPSARLLRAGMAAFERHGFAEVRVDDVCRAAKVAKGSFYRHYRSKEELFFAAASAAGDEVARVFSAEAGPDGLDLDEAVGVLTEALSRHLPLLLDLMALAAQRRPGHARAARRIFAGLRAAVGEGVASGLDAEEAGALVVDRALSACLRRLVGDESMAPDTLVDVM
ncbi:MAG TPA: TetR family transcriptional regulator [Acidimicrobiales bacterium]